MWTDWINFGISFLIVFVCLLLAVRLLLALMIRLVHRTSSEYDEAYLRSIRPQVNLLILVISLDFATTRLPSIPDTLEQTLLQLYFAVIVLIIAVIVWKLIDYLVL
jgi:hypothetical protein